LRQDELKVAEDELSSIDKNSPFAKPLNLRGDDPARVFFVTGASAEIYTTPSTIMNPLYNLIKFCKENFWRNLSKKLMFWLVMQKIVNLC